MFPDIQIQPVRIRVDCPGFFRAAWHVFHNGANCPNQGDLDALYCDANKDLVADFPTDPKKLKKPSFYQITYQKDWAIVCKVAEAGGESFNKTALDRLSVAIRSASS